MSYQSERAYQEIQKYGRALLKYITPNEVDNSQSHQSGYLIPISAARLFTPQAPTKGINHTHDVEILWPDGSVTNSAVKWYGKKTRREYRITRYGRGSAWANNADLVGQLLVLIPITLNKFHGHILGTDEEVEDLLSSLGIEILSSYAIYDQKESIRLEDSDTCILRRFVKFVKENENFPSGKTMSFQAREALENCIIDFKKKKLDEQLVVLVEKEYELFKLLERAIYSPRLTTLFKSVDDFLELAMSIINSRKSRAGRSLENHIEQILLNQSIPHKMRAHIQGAPDVIFPSVEAYKNRSFPENRLTMLAVKTTCKDRWRQILQEAPRIQTKHLLTLQPTLSSRQFEEINAAGVKLVVPSKFHRQYPSEAQASLLTVEEFVSNMKSLYPHD